MNDVNHLTHFPSKRANASTSMTRAGGHLILSNIQGTSESPVGLDWPCPLCGATVYPTKLPNGIYLKRRTCDCQLRERREAAEREQMEAWDRAQAARTFGGWLGLKWVDNATIAQLKSKTFASFKRERDGNAYTIAARFADSMHGNLIFYGEYGAGKTHLAAAICNAIRERRVTSLFMAAGIFFTAYNDRLRRDEDAYALERQAVATPLLVIDDVDKAHATDARLDVYWRILEGRYTARRPTVITTNRMVERLDTNGRVLEPGLADYIGGAARSRFMRGLEAVEMTGDDYRLEEE